MMREERAATIKAINESQLDRAAKDVAIAICNSILDVINQNLRKLGRNVDPRAITTALRAMADEQERVTRRLATENTAATGTVRPQK
jgi:hypothetical protein